SELNVKDFNFEAFRLAKPEDHQQTILDLIMNSLALIGSRHGADLRPVHEAAERVRECGFRLDIPTKLSRSTPDRRLRLNVVCKLSLELGEAWAVEVHDKAGDLEGTYWITERPGDFDWRGRFKKSHWSDGSLIIEGRFGGPVIRFNVARRAV